MPLPDSQIKETIARRWDNSSVTYDTYAGHGIKSAEERDAWKNMFKKTLPAATRDILDVGCGTGELSQLLAEMGYRVTGLDLSPKMVEKAKNKAAAHDLEIRYECGDAENIPYSENTYDVVFNRHVLWTLPNPEKTLEGWKRVLRNDGRMMIVDGLWDDGSLNMKARQVISNLCTMVVERKNPLKEYYGRELRSSLPNVGGTPIGKAEDYLKNAGLINVGHEDLRPIREIQRKGMPFREQVRDNSEYYLVFGNK